MKYNLGIFFLILVIIVACGSQEEGVLDSQIESLDKAKDLEKSIQDAAEAQRKLIEEQASQ